MSEEPGSHRVFIERLVIALAVVGLALLLWNLRNLFLLVFGSVLVAVILNLIAVPIRERLRFPPPLALFAAVLVVVAVIGTAFWALGAEVTRQAATIRQLIPAAWAAIEARLDTWGLARPCASGPPASRWARRRIQCRQYRSVDRHGSPTRCWWSSAASISAQPELYRVGMIKLVPARGRALAARRSMRAAARCARAARPDVSMAVAHPHLARPDDHRRPSALTLACSPLARIVPFIADRRCGPGDPARLRRRADKALWVAFLFLAIRNSRASAGPLSSSVPSTAPALLLFALVAGGLVFGIAGILLARR